jgi:hypothetical protein
VLVHFPNNEERNLALEIRPLLLTTVVFISLLGAGCETKSPNQLSDGFQSYETPNDVRKKISDMGLRGRWQETTDGVAASGSRPAYSFLTMSGPFTASGVEGHMKLTFYNDRLMSTEFSTERGREYLARLREQNVKLPDNAGKEIGLAHSTKFRYDVDPDGKFRFSWTDPNLQAEWLKWVKDHS